MAGHRARFVLRFPGPSSRPPTTRRALLALLAIVVVGLGMPALALAAAGWGLTATPTTIPEDVPRDVAMRLTDTDGSGDIGCTRITIPATTSILGVQVTGTSAASPWVGTVGPGQLVRIYNEDGNGKLHQGDWVDFRVTVRGDTAGSWSWVGSALQNDDCTGSPFLANISISMTVTPAPTPAPSPTAAPTATPVPSAAPPSPTPSSLPTSSPPVATPTPSLGTLTPTPGTPARTPSASQESSSAPSPRSSEPGVGAAVSGPGGDGSNPSARTEEGPAARIAPLLDAESTLGGLGIQALALLDGPLVWFIPGATLAGPGLLVLLWIALQTLGTLLWVPAVRRVSGGAGDRRHRRPPPAPSV